MPGGAEAAPDSDGEAGEVAASDSDGEAGEVAAADPDGEAEWPADLKWAQTSNPQSRAASVGYEAHIVRSGRASRVEAPGCLVEAVEASRAKV